MPTEKEIRDLLKARFGYDQFRPLQLEIIKSALAGRDNLVLMPTGGGKSLCYQLPALLLPGLTLVVSPLIALMKDQVDALTDNGIAAACVNSSLPPEAIHQAQAAAQRGRLKLLYVAPERLAAPGFRDWLRSLKLSLIAIDEAHCISEWGHEFRPDYRNLKALRREFPGVPVIALTATATEKVREDITAQLELRGTKPFVSSFNRPNLSYQVQPKRGAFPALVNLLRSEENRPAIVYCFSRKDTEELAAELEREGISARPYHAGLDNAIRQQTQEQFIHDEIPVIVATIAFGMGIDKPDIRLVAHYDLPKSVEGYYQETGRAGRDGLPSRCVLFYGAGDQQKHGFFIGKLEDVAARDLAWEKLRRMADFAELTSCRRRYLLEYFGEPCPQDNCQNCDNCLADLEPVDLTELAQKILSTVIRTGERFGASHVTAVLRGGDTEKIRSLGHDKLSVYGVAQDQTATEIRQACGWLEQRGLLAKTSGEYPTLAVTPQGREFLKKRDRLVISLPRRQAEAPVPASTTPEYDRALFAQLRTLRKQLADAKGVPPYVVFGDAALQQMAAFFPQSEASLLRINGVGAAKLEQYGEDFLREIKRYAQARGLKERMPRSSQRKQQREPEQPRRLSSTYTETRRLCDAGLSIEEIAEQRGLSEATVIRHLDHLIGVGEAVNIAHLLPPPERLARIHAAFRQTGDLALNPVHDILGSGYSYEELWIGRLTLRQKQRAM